MPVATVAAVRKQIQSGSADAVYLIQGEDEVEKAGLARPVAMLSARFVIKDGDQGNGGAA